MKRKFSKNCEIVHSFASNIIKERREMIEKKKQDPSLVTNKKKYLDFIDILLAVKVLFKLISLVSIFFVSG